MAEHQPSKLVVAGSNPVPRSPSTPRLSGFAGKARRSGQVPSGCGSSLMVGRGAEGWRAKPGPSEARSPASRTTESPLATWDPKREKSMGDERAFSPQVEPRAGAMARGERSMKILSSGIGDAVTAMRVNRTLAKCSTLFSCVGEKSTFGPSENFSFWVSI